MWMLISMLRLKYIVLVVYDLPDKFNFCINRGWVQNLDQINSLTSIKYNRYNIIVLWDVNEWFNLVIALHSPIFSGECFLAAGDYGGNVLVSTVFLFFFYRRKVGWGQGGATGVCKLHLHVPFASWNQLFETSAVEFTA